MNSKRRDKVLPLSFIFIPRKIKRATTCCQYSPPPFPPLLLPSIPSLLYSTFTLLFPPLLFSPSHPLRPSLFLLIPIPALLRSPLSPLTPFYPYHPSHSVSPTQPSFLCHTPIPLPLHPYPYPFFSPIPLPFPASPFCIGLPKLPSGLSLFFLEMSRACGYGHILSFPFYRIKGKE